MRSVLLAGSAVVGLIAGSGQARAQMAVHDLVGDLWQGLNNSELVAQVAQATKTVSELQQQYTQLVTMEGTLTSTFNSVAHPTNVMSLVTGLTSGLDSNPLPSNTNSILGLANGTNLNVSGLSGMATQFLNQNRNYMPQQNGGDFNAAWLNGRANSLAGLQAMVTQLMHSSQDRLNNLPQLQQQIDSAPDIQAMGAINARINSEVAIAQAQSSQIAQIKALADLQREAQGQQAEQQDRQSADSLYNTTQALP